jgi:hypothetical protein
MNRVGVELFLSMHEDGAVVASFSKAQCAPPRAWHASGGITFHIRFLLFKFCATPPSTQCHARVAVSNQTAVYSEALLSLFLDLRPLALWRAHDSD